jgi:hypothetical protein
MLLAGGVMLGATILSEYAPHFRRALGAAPMVAAAAGLGLALLLDWAGGWRKELREWPHLAVRLRAFVPPLVCGAVLLASAYLGVQAYFGRWDQSPLLFYAYDEGLWDIGQYVNSLPAGEREHIYLSPRPAGDMTLAFAWREGPEVRRFDGRHALVTPAYAAGVERATFVIVDHEDFRGSGVLRELYPGAQEVRTFLDREGQVYARAFTVANPGVFAHKPEHAAAFRWPDVALTGYDLDQRAFRPGETVYLQLWWRSLAPARADWTVFTHLLGPAHKGSDGQETLVWSGRDSRPGDGSATMPTWRPGDLVLDEYQIRVPEDAPAGTYTVEVGLYDLNAGGARASLAEPVGADHVVLGQVTVARDG